MTAVPGAEGPLQRTGPDVDPEIGLFARVEGLAGEEAALLRVPAHERTAHQHDRLRVIGDELDRIFEHLRERAHRRGRADPGASGQGA
jgi:hypothetical protein